MLRKDIEEDKIMDMTNLVTKAILNAKTNEVKGEMRSITNSATKTTLNAVENKIPSASNLVKNKMTIAQKINEIAKKNPDHNQDKCITTPDFTNLRSENMATRLKQACLARKNDIANFINKTDFDNKLKYVTSNKNELNEISKNKLKQYQQKD